MSKLYGPLTVMLNRRLHKWAENKRGATAVEFALIAIPFFFLLFSLIEICVIFIMGTVLEHALTEASRQIRTGQSQTSGASEAAFRQAICDRMVNLMDCSGAFYLDVRTFDSFTDATDPDPIDPDGNFDDGGFGFAPGAENEIVVVRAFYEWPLFTPILSQPLANVGDNKHLLRATIAFRNEPFGETS